MYRADVKLYSLSYVTYCLFGLCTFMYYFLYICKLMFFSLHCICLQLCIVTSIGDRDNFDTDRHDVKCYITLACSAGVMCKYWIRKWLYHELLLKW